jgi:hypothetical protein
MVQGTCFLSQTGIGFLAAGLALPHLFFEDETNGKQSILSWRDPAREAYRCMTCGALTVCPPAVVAEEGAEQKAMENVEAELKKRANEGLS